MSIHYFISNVPLEHREKVLQDITLDDEAFIEENVKEEHMDLVAKYGARETARFFAEDETTSHQQLMANMGGMNLGNAGLG